MKRFLTITAATLAVATPALAHHPLNGMPMETFSHGLLSGMGHPVLGFDHLFFVAAVGIAALFTAQRLLAPGVYILAMLVGCGMMYAGIALPLQETMIALSLLILGGALLSGRAMGTPVTLAVFAAFGLFHGAAFGGSVAGSEGGVGGAVLLGYLIGLGMVQYLVALAIGWAGEKLLGASSAGAINSRLMGAMVAGIGVFLCLEIVEGPILGLLTAA